jgi:hypothetical protein
MSRTAAGSEHNLLSLQFGRTARAVKSGDNFFASLGPCNTKDKVRARPSRDAPPGVDTQNLGEVARRDRRRNAKDDRATDLVE